MSVQTIVPGLYPISLYEDLAEGQRSLCKLAALDFESACFSHGSPIRKSASAAFRRKWPVEKSQV